MYKLWTVSYQGEVKEFSDRKMGGRVPSPPFSPSPFLPLPTLLFRFSLSPPHLSPLPMLAITVWHYKCFTVRCWKWSSYICTHSYPTLVSWNWLVGLGGVSPWSPGNKLSSIESGDRRLLQQIRFANIFYYEIMKGILKFNPQFKWQYGTL